MVTCGQNCIVHDAGASRSSRHTVSEICLSHAVQQIPMPATLEVVCTDDSCELDMFELHYTYDMPDDVGVADFQCPYCGGVDCLREVEL